jgi:hypothetical protein
LLVACLHTDCHEILGYFALECDPPSGFVARDMKLCGKDVVAGFAHTTTWPSDSSSSLREEIPTAEIHAERPTTCPYEAHVAILCLDHRASSRSAWLCVDHSAHAMAVQFLDMRVGNDRSISNAGSPVASTSATAQTIVSH